MRFLLLLSFATALALPVQAQLAITVQQNGQSAGVANGGSITMNASAANQSAVATITITNVGTTTIAPALSPAISGPFSLTSTSFSAVLIPSQSASVALSYTPGSSAVASGQFTWPYSQTAVVGGVVTVVGTGQVLLNLVGTTPNLTVGEITATNSFLPVASGGTIQFPNTALNAVSSITMAISNTGSGAGTITSITTSGSQYLLGGVPVLPITLNPGTQFSFAVQFQPTSAGSAPGSLQLAFGNGTYTATLAANGVASLLSYTVTQGGTISSASPGQTLAVSNTQIGSSSSALIQFQNLGTTAVVLNAIAVSGAGFTIVNPPFLPLTLQPQQSNSLTVVYTPTVPGLSTGRLQIGTDSFPLSATGLGPLLAFSYQVGGATQSVNPGGAVTFPAVPDGQIAPVQFTITNTGTSAATVASIGVGTNTSVFTVTGLPALPLQLNSGAAVTFNVNFAPLTLGALASTLLINSQTFGLSGFGTAPPALPAYQFTGASGTQQPFQQPALGLSLSSPYSIPLSGTLTISIISSSFVADPAVQFSSGGSKVAFSIPANTLQAIFTNGSSQIQFQTGTVAGAIQITPDFTIATAGGADITPANPPTLLLTIPSQAPALLTASVSSQNLASFSISVTGFTTTRSLQSLTFQLKPASGSTLSATTITLDMTALSTTFFPTAASQAAGGQFLVTVPFALTQSGASGSTNLASDISSVSVTATNAIGTSNTVQVVIP